MIYDEQDRLDLVRELHRREREDPNFRWPKGVPYEPERHQDLSQGERDYGNKDRLDTDIRRHYPPGPYP